MSQADGFSKAKLNAEGVDRLRAFGLDLPYAGGLSQPSPRWKGLSSPAVELVRNSGTCLRWKPEGLSRSWSHGHGLSSWQRGRPARR